MNETDRALLTELSNALFRASKQLQTTVGSSGAANKDWRTEFDYYDNLIERVRIRLKSQ